MIQGLTFALNNWLGTWDWLAIDNNAETIEIEQLPWSVRASLFGIGLSMLGLAACGAITKIVDNFFPLLGNGIPFWLWPILILVWTPAVAGIVLGYAAIIRYPFISLAMEWTPTLTSTKWFWVALGWVFRFIGALFGSVCIFTIVERNTEILAIVCSGHLSATSFFVGFLLAKFNRDQHPTVATFINLTVGFGVAVVPLYFRPC